MLNNSGHDKLESKRPRKFIAGSLFMVSFGILLLIAFSPLVYAETITVDAEGDSFEVEYSATGLTLSAIETDLEIPSVILTVDVTGSSSTLDIVLERSFLDSKFEDVDDDFIILSDGDFANFTETDTTVQSRTLNIDVPSGTEEIEIIGSVFGDSSSVLVIDITEPVEDTPEPTTNTTDSNDLGIASFVDETKDPQSYVDRYNTEESYKQWFDDNFPQYSSIYQAVGLEEPTVDVAEPIVDTPKTQCGPGTILQDGACVLESTINDNSQKTQCGPGTTLQDGACVLDERCGPGTILQDGACVLEPTSSNSNASDISVKGLGKELVIGLIAAFVVAGIIGIILALMSKASKSSD